MDEQNKYLEENKSLIENKIHINENSHCDDLIKDVKEECILYDRIPGYLEENQQEIFQTYNDINKQKVNILLSEISSLSPKERLLLYFKVPGGQSDVDPLRQHQNPLGTRLEINRTINWIKSHLEHDPEVSIPKQDVYNDYCVFCKNSSIKPLSTADFGKVMKQVFPNVKPRRLGTRGNSRYCYAAMRKVTKLTPPHITVTDNIIQKDEFFEEIDKESWTTIKKWFEEVTHSSFNNIKELAQHIEANNINAVPPSKMILQRKYMQRYNNKKKFPDLNVKRKKKRKRKNSLNTDTVVPACISPVTLKVEEFSDSNNSYNSSAAVLPMNLAIDNPDIQKSNHSSIYNDSDINQSSMDGINLKNQISSGVSELFEQKIKEDKSENLQFNSVNDILVADKNSLNHPSQNLLQQRNDESNLMGPPQFQPNSELYTTNINLRKRLILESMHRNLNKDSTGGGNDGENGNDDKDVLLQNLGLPRERVISICNMDKHELDDYLPNIENPDEQDAELLQYFQVPESSAAQKTDESSHSTASLIECKSETATNLSVTVYPDNNLPQTKINDEYNTVKTLNLNRKSMAAAYPSEYYSNNKNNSSLIYTRDTESFSNIYCPSNLDQRNFKGIGPNYGSYSSTRNRYNFVPITSKVNSNLNTRPIVNTNNAYSSYSTRIYNPTISASAPTSPNILKQKNIPSYSFDNVEKYDNIQMQNVIDPIMKINSNESLEFRSRSVPLNGPKIEEIDSNPDYNISECQSVVQTPIPHDFNDFNELINGPDCSLDATLNNPIRTSQNLYIPQLNSSDLQNISKKAYDHFAQKYTMNKSTITRSNPATPLPVMSSAAAATVNKNSLINNFELNLIKQHNNKMFDLSKSVPTTPIESAEPSMFRFSPDMKNNTLIGVENNPNCIDLKRQKNICSTSGRIAGPLSTTNINLNGLNLLENDSAAEILNNL